ncbi:transposase family Tnp2 protein, partial [Rhizoctonia solani AG-3 Rhs1AP]
MPRRHNLTQPLAGLMNSDIFKQAKKQAKTTPKICIRILLDDPRSPANTQAAQPWSQSDALPGSSQMPISRGCSPEARSCSGAGSGCLPDSFSGSHAHLDSAPLSWSPQYADLSPADYPGQPSLPLPTTSVVDVLSDKEIPHLHVVTARTDVDFFGRDLANLSISGASKTSGPVPHDRSHGDNDPPDEPDDDPLDNDRGEAGARAGLPGVDGPGDPDDQDDAQVNEAEIQVPPDDAGGAPGDPGGDDAGWNFPALDEHATLRNIYLRVWVQYAFHGATQETIQAMLESHKSALLAGANYYPPEFLDQVYKMPTTMRSLERRLGMDFSELVTIYPVCPECGKRYTMDELYALPRPQCQRYIEDQCAGILYTEITLADGTRKRTPARSFPYNSLLAALGRLLSRVGIADMIQHWRRNPGDAPLENPPEPQDTQEWYERIGPHTRFGDITRASSWHAQATGLRRGFNGEEYVDQPTGNAPLSLARLPIGLNLGVGADGYRVFKGGFAASNYSANGVYIVVNNLPFFLRNLIENTILALVLPGPHEPKGYAFDQMHEPLVDDLIRLADGVELPVYNSETGVIEQRLVYANLSVLIVDWISRIKCTGHVGVAAEENHCPYCKMRQCQLATPQGYQLDEYELRDPHEHLQAKHRWLRAPEHEREDIRLETGTVFTEFDRIPGFFAFDNAPLDAMHLLDLGVTHSIAQTIVYKNGMLRKQFHRQDYEDSPEGRFDAFLARTIFPHHCSRLPSQAHKMDGRTKAEQWRLLRVVMPVAYFEAWRVGDVIPNDDIPTGGQNTLDFKAQERNAQLLPQVEDCYPSRNPRDYYANILRYCVGSTLITRHQVTLAEIEQAEAFFEQVGMEFTVMNVHLTPSFHAITHLPDHVRKYGSTYNTLTARFERANRLLANVNINGHGNGVLESTMAKGFLRRTECYRYVRALQSIEEPTADDTKTTEVLLGAMRNGPEHEVQRGMLEAVLVGEAPMHGQEEIRLATTSAQVDFRDEKHRIYYQHIINFCNHHRPEALNNVIFYGHGRAPDEGRIPIHVRPVGSTLVYPHFRRYGVRYGSASHHRGTKSRYGYIHNRVPVLIQGIYERFVAPNDEPAFPWNHWNEILGIDAWKYDRLAPLEAVPPTVFTGVFALSDLTMPNGHFWVTIAMINTRPEDLAGDGELDVLEEDNE